MGWSSTLVQHLLRAKEDNMMNRFHTFAYACSKLSEQEKQHGNIVVSCSSQERPLMSTLWTHLGTKQLIYRYTYVYTPNCWSDFLIQIDTTHRKSRFWKVALKPQGFPSLNWMTFSKARSLEAAKLLLDFGASLRQGVHRLTKWHLSATIVI